nr:transducin beta-like protein 3 [Saimiri boliviensis boliviensis]
MSRQRAGSAELRASLTPHAVDAAGVLAGFRGSGSPNMAETEAGVGRFKADYVVERKIEPFYKGGNAQLDQTGQHLVCVCSTKVHTPEVASGAMLRRLEQEDQDDTTAFDLSPDSEALLTASRALLRAPWAWQEGSVTRLWAAIHTAPVATVTLDPTSTLLATGGCDGAVRVCDMARHSGTHRF